MKIGITEHGDAGIDFRWEQKLTELNGAVLITKNLTDTFIQKVILHSENFPIIVHCTCTGWGGSMLEPNVPDFKTQLNQLQKLIKAGFPVERTVLRVDPIFPTEKGLQQIQEMFAYYHTLNLPEDKIRYRMSIVDEYPHVRERYKKIGFAPIYNGGFSPTKAHRLLVGDTLSKLPYQFDTCAEDVLANEYPDTFNIKGCISREDLSIMGIAYETNLFENPQKRTGCHCLSCKTELLRPRKTCPHNCLYCFWKD